MFEDAIITLSSGEDTDRRRFCGFSRWVRTLSDADRATAEDLLADPQWNCRRLANYFVSKGARLNDQVLTRHRNGRCCGQQH